MLVFPPEMGSRGQEYRHYRWMAINTLVQQLCREEKVGFVGMFLLYMRDGLYLSGNGAAVFVDELLAAVDRGMGCITNIFGSKHCLN